MDKKIVLQLGEDGLPLDDVSHYTATPEQLRTYEQAAEDLARLKVPQLLDRADPHSYLIVGLMDGTGNDFYKDPLHATNVAKFRQQLEDLEKAGEKRLYVEYIEGPGTQDSLLAKTLDGATGRTSLFRAEEMYERLKAQSQNIFQADPEAKIAFHLEGFSRGASQVPLLARMIDARGIPDEESLTLVSDTNGNLIETYNRYHQPPGLTPMTVGLYDPVATGYMELFDRRLPPSVVGGVQFSASEERRGLFKAEHSIPLGISDDGRFGHVSLAAYHSNMGGGYLRDGMSIRTLNLMTDYHNGLISEPLFYRLQEPTDPRINVLHRSEEGNLLFRGWPKVDRATPDGQLRQLTADYGYYVPPGEVATIPVQAPEALRSELAHMLQSARPFQRTALIDTAISTNGDAFIARLSQSVDAATLEIRPYPPPMLASSGVRAAGALGVAATLYEAQASGEKIATLLSQSNPLAAQSELAHFAGRNVGGWAGGTAAAYALGASGAGPMALIAADAYVMSKAGEKAADLLDNRAIYNQTDRAGTQWSFNGTAWTREGQADTSNDGIDNPTTTQIVASYAKARELNYQATNAAAALALKDAPAPQNPYRLPASAGDPPSLSAADWARDPSDGQWRRTVQSGVVADADSAVYRTDIAPPPRAAELDAQAQQVIAGNIANSPGAIAARYELAYQRSGWAAAGLPLSDTLRQALPNPDALTASDGQQYRRDADGRWTGASGAASGNVALELDTTRALLQPALAEHAQAVAALAQTPPSAQDLQREETLYRYRITGTELKPEWREAIDLATQRTRAAHGLAGDGSMKLQRGPTGAFGADSPIAHFQRDADGVDRLAAVTSSEDIRQALQQVRAQQTQPASPDQPALHFTATGHASDGSANGDASSANASSGPQLVLDLQARSQAARVAQARQEREQQERLAQAQHAAQVREHIQQAQPEREGRSQSEQALQAHAVLDRQNQAQQREHQEREVQERQAQDNQQREQEIAQAQQVQKHAQEQQVQDARSPEQQPLHAKDAVTPEQEPRAHQIAQQVQHQTQDAQQPEPALEVQNVQAHETHTHAQTKAQQQVSHGQSQAAEMAQPHTLGQQTREQRTRDTEQRDAQTAAIAHEPSAYPQHDAIVREQQLPTAPASVAGHDVPAQQSNDPAHAHLAQMTSAPTPRSLATPMAAEHNNAQHTPTSQWQAMEALDNSAAMSSHNRLTQTVGQSLKEDRADRSADSPESVAPAIQVPSVAQTVEQDAPAAPAPGSPESWQATLQKLRALRVQLEQDLETENRISQARQARIARGQQPYTALELRDGYDPDGPSALRKIASSSQGAVSRTDADTAIAQTGSEQSDGLQPRRRAISKNSDVNDLIYAIDSKNDLAIDEALKRIANSASTHALIQRGREHLEAKAMQEAQEQVTAHQALAMDMPAEVQTSRGPVMVMTLPQFAHGPMMQGGPQGDGGGGDGGGGGGAGGGGGGGG